MSRLGLSGAALGVAVGLGMLLAVSAYALPEALYTIGNTAGTTAEVQSLSEVIVETASGTSARCRSASGTGGGAESDTSGTFHATFERCEAGALKTEPCESEGDSTGSILALGTFRFVYDSLDASGVANTLDEQSGGSLGVAILFEPSTTSFDRGSIGKIEIKGPTLCLVLAPLTVSVAHEFHCNRGSGKGEAAEKSYWNE